MTVSSASLIKLTRKEHSLVEHLALNSGRVVSRGMIVERVWDQSFEGLDEDRRRPRVPTAFQQIALDHPDLEIVPGMYAVVLFRGAGVRHRPRGKPLTDGG